MDKNILIAMIVAGSAVLAYYLWPKSGNTQYPQIALTGGTPSPYPGGVRTYTPGGTPIAGPLTNFLGPLSNLFGGARTGNVGFSQSNPSAPPPGVSSPSLIPVGGSPDFWASVDAARPTAPFVNYGPIDLTPPDIGTEPLAMPIDLGTGTEDTSQIYYS